MIPFRKAMIAILSILYSTAAGLALYRLPTVWGGDRIVLNGFYLRSSLDLILKNIPVVLKNLSDAWEGHFLAAVVWGLFYLLTVVLAARMALRWRKNKKGNIQNRVIPALLFFPIQLITSLGAGLLSVDPALRYFLPVVFIPLFWGWPILAASDPGWMRHMRGKQLVLTGSLLLGIAVFIVFHNARSSDNQINVWNYYPDSVRCIDENTRRLGLRNGLAQYWLARPITLLSKTGLVVVQVNPDLSPSQILNNSDGYENNFDFIIIDSRSFNGDPQNGHWIHKDFVIKRFGEPASTFFCQDNEILVYNRSSDTAFRNLFNKPIDFTN